MKLSRTVQATAVIAPLALASTMLSSCSTSSASASCGDTLKYGILTAFTGELGEFGKTSKHGFDLALEQIKKSGELPKGWKVSTTVSDEKSDIQTGLRAATDMMQNDKISAILGPSSGPIVAMASVANRYRTPIISQFAGTTNFSQVGGKYLFRTVASDASDGTAVATYLKDRGAKNVVIIVQNDQSTVTAGQAAEEGLKANGSTVKRMIKYTPGQPSYQAVVQQAISQKPDAYYLAGGQESAITILKDMRANGIDSSDIIVSADLVVPDVIKAIGANWAEGLSGETPQADEKRPEYGTMAKDYEAKFGNPPEIFVSNAYDAANLVALAAVAADSTCGSAIAAELPKVAGPGGEKVNTFAEGAKLLADGKDVDYEGASGPVDFDETGTVAGSYGVFQVKSGAWKLAKFYPAEVFNK